jgi:hypothetical protein
MFLSLALNAGESCGDVSMLIAGTFREYPFFLLLEILLHRKETGLLEVSSIQESGYFYIKNGKVKDGQIGKSKGVAAVKLVGKFNDGSFRFKAIEPTDYARVVWQRSFGPTGLAIGQPAIPAYPVTKKLGQFGFNPAAAYRVLSDLGSSTHRRLRQFLLHTSTAYHGLQKSGAALEGRTVACAAAGVAFWKRVQVGTRLPLAIATIRRALGQFLSSFAAAYRVSEQLLASSAMRALRQLLLYIPVAYHSLQRNGLFLIQRTVAYVIAVFALWKRAHIGTRLLQVLKKLLAARQDKRRRDRQRRDRQRRDRRLRPEYRREVSFRVTLPTVPRGAAISSALQQGVEHNLIFASIVTVLLGMSILLLYQIVLENRGSIDTGITVDEHLNPPANATRTRAKPKRQGSKRPSTDKSRDKSVHKKPGVSSKQQPGVLPQTQPTGPSEYDLRDDGAVPKRNLENDV